MLTRGQTLEIRRHRGNLSGVSVYLQRGDRSGELQPGEGGSRVRRRKGRRSVCDGGLRLERWPIRLRVQGQPPRPGSQEERGFGGTRWVWSWMCCVGPGTFRCRRRQAERQEGLEAGRERGLRRESAFPFQVPCCWKQGAGCGCRRPGEGEAPAPGQGWVGEG